MKPTCLLFFLHSFSRLFCPLIGWVSVGRGAKEAKLDLDAVEAPHSLSAHACCRQVIKNAMCPSLSGHAEQAATVGNFVDCLLSFKARPAEITLNSFVGHSTMAVENIRPTSRCHRSSQSHVTVERHSTVCVNLTPAHALSSKGPEPSPVKCTPRDIVDGGWTGSEVPSARGSPLVCQISLVCWKAALPGYVYCTHHYNIISEPELPHPYMCQQGRLLQMFYS